MGMAEGLLRIFPGFETTIFGYTFTWSVIIPGQIIPVAMLLLVLAYPYIEAWITGDKQEHHLLQRPRNAPNRTAFLVAMMTLFGLLWAGGGNDILATQFQLNLNQITYFLRVAVFVGPVVAFVITRRWCISLQRKDEERLLHGYETGVITRSPDGGYAERHAPIPMEEAFTLTSGHRDEVYRGASITDGNGVPAKRSLVASRLDRARARLSRYWFGDNVKKPTRVELEAARHHLDHELEEHKGDELVAADGHQFDGRHAIEGDELRKGH
jgi:ubiquinol-cytochrome c reductase cytochrome b subunit